MKKILMVVIAAAIVIGGYFYWKKLNPPPANWACATHFNCSVTFATSAGGGLSFFQ